MAMTRDEVFRRLAFLGVGLNVTFVTWGILQVKEFLVSRCSCCRLRSFQSYQACTKAESSVFFLVFFLSFLLSFLSSCFFVFFIFLCVLLVFPCALCAVFLFSTYFHLTPGVALLCFCFVFCLCVLFAGAHPEGGVRGRGGTLYVFVWAGVHEPFPGLDFFRRHAPLHQTQVVRLRQPL